MAFDHGLVVIEASEKPTIPGLSVKATENKVNLLHHNGISVYEIFRLNYVGSMNSRLLSKTEFSSTFKTEVF